MSQDQLIRTETKQDFKPEIRPKQVPFYQVWLFFFVCLRVVVVFNVPIIFLYFLVKQDRTEKPLAAVDNKKLYGSSMKYLTKRMLERTTGRSNEQTEQENEKQNKVCAKELVTGPRSN